MESPVLQAERRSLLGTRAARRLRREGKVPAVLYGHEVENIPITIPQKDLKTAIQAGARMVSVRWDDKEEMALLKETQYDAFGKEILHADLVRVALDKRIVLEVPIELRGTPAGLAEDGVLEQVLRKVKVECLPRAIPEKLTADVSRLRLGESITFKDLELPHDVKLAEEDPGAMVAMVRKIVEEEVKPAVEEEAVKEPEVIVRKPKEEEEEKEEKT